MILKRYLEPHATPKLTPLTDAVFQKLISTPVLDKALMEWKSHGCSSVVSNDKGCKWH